MNHGSNSYEKNPVCNRNRALKIYTADFSLSMFMDQNCYSKNVWQYWKKVAVVKSSKVGYRGAVK